MHIGGSKRINLPEGPLSKRAFFLYAFCMETLSNDSPAHVLYIPGTSGLEDTARIAYLDKSVRDAGLTFSCLHAWSDSSDLQSKTLAHIFENIHATVAAIEPNRDVHVIAKSFGGGLLLLRGIPRILKMVLWAPVAHVSDVNCYESIKDTLLKDIPSMSSITTNTLTLQEIQAPTLILRGTQDSTVSLERLQSIVQILPHGELEEIPMMGHSPHSEEELETLVTKSISFLNAS